MGIDPILHNLRDLCDSPVAWTILAVVTLRAAWSLVVFLRCPILHHADQLDPAAAAEAAARPHLNSPRFLVSMLAGIALAVGGLYALRAPDAGPMALAAIVFGSFLMIVEPSRLGVEENMRRAAAARLADAESQAFALERLRASHFERLAVEFMLAGLLAAVILTV